MGTGTERVSILSDDVTTLCFSCWISNNRPMNNGKKEDADQIRSVPPLPGSTRGHSTNSPHSSGLLVSGRFFWFSFFMLLCVDPTSHGSVQWLWLSLPCTLLVNTGPGACGASHLRGRRRSGGRAWAVR